MVVATGYRLTGSGHRGQQFLDSVKGKRDKRDQVFVVTLTDIHDFRQPLSGTEVRRGRGGRPGSRGVTETEEEGKQEEEDDLVVVGCVCVGAGGRGLRRTEGLGGSKRGRQALEKARRDA